MVNISVRARFLTLTVSTPEIIERTIQQGRTSHIQRERVMRTTGRPARRNACELALSMEVVNRVFAPADVAFQLLETTSASTAAPNGREALDDPGFLMLAREFPMVNNVVSLLLVNRFQGSEGGAAVESLGVCAVGDGSPDSSLAHEFGHLLGLGHQGDIRDLMNPGLSVPMPVLSRVEIDTIRASALVTRLSH